MEIFGQDHPDGSTPIHLNSIKSKAGRPKELEGLGVYESLITRSSIGTIHATLGFSGGIIES